MAASNVQDSWIRITCCVLEVEALKRRGRMKRRIKNRDKYGQHFRDCWVRFTRKVLHVRPPRRRGGMNRRNKKKENQEINQNIAYAVTEFMNNKEEWGGALEED